jgi:formylmethanofuran:tetrahydromethanopterin formyltransferase
MMYQLGWATLPGLKGLSVSEFRATPTETPDNQKGVAISFTNESERDTFLKQLEEHFAQRRFTNAADAFDTVKAYVLESVARGH